MSCNLINSIGKVCRSSGGVIEVYLSNYPTGYTGSEWFTLDTSGSTITSISGTSFLTFIPRKNTASANENILGEMGVGVEQVIEMTFNRNDAYIRDAINIMSQANMVGIVRYRDGSYKLFGAQSGLEVSAGTRSSGVNVQDLNGFTITLMGQEGELAYEVSSTIISGLLSS
jgi:hypothetical protein